ncbi:MAG: hypothetical protein M5T61_12375 [Acidimicrobiia bacterium]|nr:hypothetical protein [Acidimicrobiia bacterium]
MHDDSILSGRKPRRRHWRMAALVVAGLVLISLAQVAWTGLRDNLREVDAELTATAGRSDATRVRIVRGYESLAVARAELAAAEATLRRRTRARDAVEARLIASQSALDDRNNLVDDQSSEIGRREANLVLLSRCFVGASEALNQIAVADLTGFVATLREVEGACTAARADS